MHIIHRPDLWSDKPTSPRTKVIAVLSVAIACSIAAIALRQYGAIMGELLVVSTGLYLWAWRMYRKLGFAGDEDDDNRRDGYCV